MKSKRQMVGDTEGDSTTTCSFELHATAVQFNHTERENEEEPHHSRHKRQRKLEPATVADHTRVDVQTACRDDSKREASHTDGAQGVRPRIVERRA